MDSYADDEELASFIVDDEPPVPSHVGNGQLSRPLGHYASGSESDGESDPEPEPHLTHVVLSLHQEEPKSAEDKLRALDGSQRHQLPPTARLLRAHISILVSALGGPDHASEDPVYKLGHDALACLKDLKRWIRAVDEKNSTYDVALACAESDLVKNDLTVILCQYDAAHHTRPRPRAMEKIMVACLELMVLLTWPTDVDRNTLMKDYAAKTSIRRAQVAYKHHILHYRQGRTLKAVLRLGLSALRVEKDAREPRDTNLLRLILFFIRNVLYIEPLPASKGPRAVTNASVLPSGISADEVLLSAVLRAFDRNNVLLFLTSIAHGVLGDLTDEAFGLLAMECLSLLTRGVVVLDVVSGMVPGHLRNASGSGSGSGSRPSLASDTIPRTGEDTNTNTPTTSVPPASSVAGLELQDLLGEEQRRKKQASSAGSSRHGRFGTLLSIRNAGNASYYVVSGQKALHSTYDTLQKLDASKQWHKASTFRNDSNAYARPASVHLASDLGDILGRFANQLLASGSYNNLLAFVGRHLTNLATDRDTGRRGLLDAIDAAELAAYFLTIAWFFRFKRERAAAYKDLGLVPEADDDPLDYGSVGEALGEVNFILLISYLRSAYQAKDHDSLHVALVCFREMLLISNGIFTQKRTQQEIDLASDADINHDRELAEGIIRKLFSQKQFLDVCVHIPKTAARHSPEFLGVVVGVVHILLKSFESLANEDIHLFIKTRRRIRRIRKLNPDAGVNSGLNADMDRENLHLIDKGSDESENEDDMRYITQERKLDLRNTEVRFFHPDTVSTHIEYLARYEDLSADDIKRVLLYFHRLFVVRKDYSALYRLDFMLLLYKLQAYLPRSSSNRRHVDDFIVYFMKKFKAALDRFPTALEVLFPRLESPEIKGFLSTGDFHSYEDLSLRKGSKLGANLGAKASSYFDEDAVQPRAAPVLHFHDENKPLDDKIGVLVYHLSKKKNTLRFLGFLLTEMNRIGDMSDLAGSEAALRLKLANRRLLILDSHLRLLLHSIGFNLPYLQNDDTRPRDSVTAENIKEAARSLEKWIALHEQGVGDIEPFLDQLQRTIFSSAQLEFGVESLERLRAGKAIDMEAAEELELDDTLIHTVVGLAKRKEYDDKVSANMYADDDFVDPPTGAESSDNENTRQTKRSRKRGSRLVDSDSGAESGNDNDIDIDIDSVDNITEKPRKRRRAHKKKYADGNILNEATSAPAKSAELVHDSDDDSDEERNNAFFDKEEKLRQLISQTGGIASKEQLSMFQESWKTIMRSNGGEHVTRAVKKASNLFVEDLDDEDSPASKHSKQETPMIAESDSLGTEPLIGPDVPGVTELLEDERSAPAPTRKRRVIVDDDDDE